MNNIFVWDKSPVMKMIGKNNLTKFMGKMVKIAEKVAGNIHPSYDLKLDEIRQIINIVENGRAAEGIALAFQYGYAMGQRATSAEQRRTARG